MGSAEWKIAAEPPDLISNSPFRISHSAARKRHRQTLEKAIVALENDPVETRSMTGMTMAVDPKKIPVAKEMIRDFNRKLCEFLESGDRTQVYELSISLFSLQSKVQGDQQ